MASGSIVQATAWCGLDLDFEIGYEDRVAVLVARDDLQLVGPAETDGFLAGFEFATIRIESGLRLQPGAQTGSRRAGRSVYKVFEELSLVGLAAAKKLKGIEYILYRNII